MDLLVVALTLLGIILISSALHEAMHAFVGFKLGDDTAARAGRLSLNPIAHIDPLLTVALPFVLFLLGLPIFGAAKPVPFNPSRVKGAEKGAALVAISGPLTNLVLAAALALPLRFVVLPNVLELIIVQAVLVNLGFFIFNSLPIPPLDGSRLAYAFSPEGIRSVMDTLERSGLLFIGVIVIVFSGAFMPVFVSVVQWVFNLLTGVPLNYYLV